MQLQKSNTIYYAQNNIECLSLSSKDCQKIKHENLTMGNFKQKFPRPIYSTIYTQNMNEFWRTQYQESLSHTDTELVKKGIYIYVTARFTVWPVLKPVNRLKSRLTRFMTKLICWPALKPGGQLAPWLRARMMPHSTSLYVLYSNSTAVLVLDKAKPWSLSLEFQLSTRNSQQWHRHLYRDCRRVTEPMSTCCTVAIAVLHHAG